LRDFTANGLGMALVFEHAAEDWRGGFDAGFANYRAARAHANSIGFPASRPIYMAVDSQVVGDANHATMARYIRGAYEAAGFDAELVGVYGQFSVVRHIAGEGTAKYLWQCRAWSGTPINYHAGRHLFQHFGSPYTIDGKNSLVSGIEVDTNEVLSGDWGQHLSRAPGGGGTEGVLMALNDAQQQELYDKVVNIDAWLVKGIGTAEQVGLTGTPAAGQTEQAGFVMARAARQNTQDLIAVASQLYDDIKIALEVLARLEEKIDTAQTGGVSEARIGEIAKEAVAGDLTDSDR
jgi:hypothetical protein